jgi:anthranilate phosphoribosyltransferase
MEASNLSFLHAPLFHPAMKNVAGIRKDLALKTFFNMLGPLVNPAQPGYQCIGVYSLELARMYHYLLQQSEVQYTIVHALDGYDEISLSSSAKIYTPHDEDLVEPFDFGCPNLEPHEIYAGDSLEDSKKIFLSILENKSTKAQKEVVIANAALGIKTVNPSLSYMECADICNESIESGKAYQTFKTLMKANGKA